MLSRLDGRMISNLHTALLGAFDHSELELLLRTALDARLDDISLGAQGFSDVVTAVLAWAERRGRIRSDLAERLKSGSLEERSSARPQPPPWVLGPVAPPADPAGVVEWAQAMARATRSVGLLEVGEGRVSTVIALTPRLVLCADGDLADVIAGQADPGSVRITFGYSSAVEGSAERSTWELDRDQPIVDHDAELGFAVILLGAPLPPDAFGGGLAAQFESAAHGPPELTPLPTSSAVPEASRPLFLLGHILGGPLSMVAALATGRDDDFISYQTDRQAHYGLIGGPVLGRRHAPSEASGAGRLGGGGRTADRRRTRAPDGPSGDGRQQARSTTHVAGADGDLSMVSTPSTVGPGG